MPFTLSHPAAVLPLRRTRLVFSALVVGSMAPDFEYFFGLKRPASHAMPGIVTFTMPLALAALIVFHKFLKWPLISLLPCGLQGRVIEAARRFRWFPATRFLLILVSLAVGMATHLMWDGFTHDDGWAVVRISPLRLSVPVFGHHRMAMHAVLQLGCTVVGIAVLAIAFAAWYRRTIPGHVALRPQFSPAIKSAILGAMAATALVLGMVQGAPWYGPLLQDAPRRARFIVGFVLTTTAAGIVELFGFSLIWRAFQSVHRARAPASADE